MFQEFHSVTLCDFWLDCVLYCFQSLVKICTQMDIIYQLKTPRFLNLLALFMYYFWYKYCSSISETFSLHACPKNLTVEQVWEFLGLFNYIFDLKHVKQVLIVINSSCAQKNLEIFVELYSGHILRSAKFKIQKHYRTFCGNQFYYMWFKFFKFITSVLLLEQF